MNILSLIEQLRAQPGPSTSALADNQPLEVYAGKTPVQLRKMVKTMLLARRLEREDQLLLRKGHSRFFIGGAGKELADVALADALRPNDPFVGYYRNKAFDLFRRANIPDKILETLGDSRAANKGQQQAHPGYPELSIIPQISVTAGHVLEAAGIAEALKHPVPVSAQSWIPGGSWPNSAIVLCCLGEGATSEGEFGRALFNASFFRSPIIFAVYNCGWAISVASTEQFPQGDPTAAYRALANHGMLFLKTDGTEIKSLLPVVRDAEQYVRSGRGPAFLDIRVTREGSHSGSDDQSHYMSRPELDRHVGNDPTFKTCFELIQDGVVSPQELVAMWDEMDREVSAASEQAVRTFQPKSAELITSLVYRYDFASIQATWRKYREAYAGNRAARFREWHDCGFFPASDLPEQVGPTTMRHAINYTLFDLLELSPDTLLFGEDVADFSGELLANPDLQAGMKGKGGVFLVTRNLQRAFGNDRCFNTPLDEAGILGRAAGHCHQGRRVIPEIQFLDYMSPGYMQLKDRICTINQRSGGLFRLPMVIRTTYGGYKQGAGAFWHSEANLGTWLNIPGLLIAVPSNAQDAAGLLKTAWACDDVVLFCESVALYNRRDWDGVPIETSIPPIDELIPFGKATVYNPDARDIGIVTYGATVHLCRRAAALLHEQGINARVIDLRTLRPCDEACILQTARECGRVMIVTEDRFPGGVAATLSAMITRGDALFHLEAPVALVTALDARVAFGTDGDQACLPTIEKVVVAGQELFHRY